MPEAHWYRATQFWILQVTASIIADPAAAAELLGTAIAHYDRSTEPQPAFVFDDLASTRAMLAERLGAAAFEHRLERGRTLQQPAAIALAIAGLHAFIDRDAVVDVA